MERIVCLRTLCIVLGPYTLDNVYETNRVSAYIIIVFGPYTLDNVYGTNRVSGYIMYCFRALYPGQCI